MYPNATKTLWQGATLALAVTLGGCGDAAGPGSGECQGADDLQSCLPSWQEFSPPEAEQPPAPDGTPTMSELTETLERIDSTGNTVSLGNVTFVCTDQTYSFTDNPERALSMNIDQTVIWPGALIQGKSHRDGGSIGGLLELPIRERAPLTVSLTFNNQDNTRVVDDPNSGSVGQAIGSMIGNAEAEGLATANNIDFKQEVYTSERQAAAAFSISGRYLGFEAKATGSYSRTTTTNVVAAHLVQQMYIAGVTQPATPAAFFNDELTDARYRDQQQLGRIGPANPPLYVSRVGFGRMMVFAMSAKAEATAIQGALQAAYRGIGGSASGSLSAKDSAILSTAEIRISQVGGNQGNALAAIQSGKLADYFTDTAELTSAAPLWFELKTLTGEVALVSEPGTYTETTCVPKLPGTFDYQSEQSLTIPFTAGTQRQTVQADVNGDGQMDLVFNERKTSPALNRVHVALAGGAGIFTIQSPAENPNDPGEGWENYTLLAGDIDGDGRDDLVWNHLGTNNVVYSGMSTGAGGFSWRDRQQHAAGGWGPYHVTAGDLNGDGKTDLLWTNGGTSVLRTYFGLAQADSSFSMIVNFVDRAGNYSGYSPAIAGQFDGANGDDFVVNAVGATFNNSYVGRFTPTSATGGTLSFPAPLVYGTSGWTNYRLRVGDIDGKQAADLVWVNIATGAIHRAVNSGNGTFAARAPQFSALSTGTIDPFVADFNNDGRSDLLMVHRASDTNELIVGFGVATGDFTFPAGTQSHPNTPGVGWVPFDQTFVGDVNGDGKADIVWTNPSSDARIYVALAK